MSFKFFASFEFTGTPTPEQFRSAYGMAVMRNVQSPISNYQTLTINNDSIDQSVDYAISQGFEAICFDEETSRFYIWNPSMTEADKDAALDCLVAIYTRAKARATQQGRPDLKIGWYDIPGGHPNNYYAPLQYAQNPSNPTYQANYQSWLAWMDRLSQRYVNGQYVSSPFSNCCDFIAPSLYIFYGNGQPFINDWKTIATTTLDQMRLRVANGKPVYSFCTFSFHPSSTYVGTMASYNNMSQMIALSRQKADGMVMWGGFGASYKYSNWFWRPSGSNEAADLTTWRTVTNGAFSITIASARLKIQNINTSSATSMTQVASILQTAIQTKISSGPNPSYDGNYPFPLGTVTVTWSSSQKGFLFNMTTNGASTPMPPNFHRGWFSIESKNAWGANISGTDLAVDQFIGAPTANTAGLPGDQQWVYGGTQSNMEWRDYAEDQDWWQAYSEASLENAELKDFKYFMSSNYTGQPSFAAFENYGINFMQTGGISPFVESYSQAATTLLTGILTINDSNINAGITAWLDPVLGNNQALYYAYDLEFFQSYLDPASNSDIVIDNMLESFNRVYTRTKELLAARGISNVKVGFYYNPNFKSYYDPVLYWFSRGNNSGYVTNYHTWTSKFRRVNLRKSGASYYTKKFSDYTDFITCDVYPFYGEQDPFDDVYYKENLIQAAKYTAGNKPLYIFLNPSFHFSTPWCSKLVSGNYMIKMLSWCKRIADGAIVWNTYRPSFRRARSRHFMTASGGPPAVPSKTLSDWQTITNGCFTYFAQGYRRNITGVNFSIATSVGGSESTSVANIIEAAINADLYYINNFFPTTAIYPSLTPSRPYEMGSVVVAYQSSVSNNVPLSSTQVPCFEFSYTTPSVQTPPDHSSYEGREFLYCYGYSGSLPVGGTDIGSALWIGTYYNTNQEYDSNIYAGQDYDPSEWANGWVVGNDWWHALSSMATADKYTRDKSITVMETLGSTTSNGNVRSFSGMPTVSQLKAQYNIVRAYTAYTADTSWSQYTDNFIDSKLDAFIAEKADIFVWDVEGSYCNVTVSGPNWSYGVSESEVDANLDQFRSLYTRTKIRAALKGISNIKVGFYGTPFAANGYYGAYYWGSGGLAHSVPGSVFDASMRRINQRYQNGVYVTVPFADYNDFYAPSLYPLYQGWTAAETDEIYVAKGYIEKVIEIFGKSRPIYPFVMPTFFEQGGASAFMGMAQNSTLSQGMYTQMLDSGADGFIMWYANQPSLYTSNHKFTPTVSKTLSQWQAITNGCFIIAVDGYPVKVENVNFSTAASMADVAQKIQDGINNKISTISIVTASYGSTWNSGSPTSPRNIGNVTVTWDSSNLRFVMNTLRGTLKSPSGMVFPPDFDKGYFVIKSWTDWTGGSPSGVDIGVDEWIGRHSVWTDLTNTRTDTVNEFGRWIENSRWWNSYKSIALGSYGTNISNRIIPFINVVTPTSGDVPFTVHVDATNSYFNGVDAQDCTFEWDFGDNNPPVSVISRTMVSDPRVDYDFNSDGSPHRKTSLSNKQRGVNAAYTYYHNNSGTPFTITLKIWHNGAVSSTVSTTVIVSNPTVDSYPTNNPNNWVLLQVVPEQLTPPSNTFQTIDAAVSWINSNRTNGKAIIELLPGYSGSNNLNFPINGKVTISKPNILIRSSTAYSTQKPRIVAKNGSFSRSSPTALFELAATAYNVNFQDIQFGASADVTGDPVGLEQGSDNTSNLIGCVIKSPASATTNASNITFSGCLFRNLYQAVTTSHFVTGVYFNQCHTSTTKIKSYDFIGCNFVLNRCFHATLNGFADGAQVFAVRTAADSPINFGGTSGLAEKLSMNFCRIDHLALLQGSSISSSGPINLYNSRYVTVYGSVLQDGSNSLNDVFAIRFDSNEMLAGGTKSLFVVTPPSSDITIVNNVLRPNTYTAGSTRINSGLFEFGGTYGLVNNLKIGNNTAIADVNTSYQKAFWNFTTATGVGLSGIEFVNNLNTEHSGYCISRWISVGTNAGQFDKFSNNVWPQRLGFMDFAFVNGVVKTWDQWVSAGYEENPSQFEVITVDLQSIYKYKLDSSINVPLAALSVLYPAACKDFNDEFRGSFSCGVGATRPYTLSYSTAAFTVSPSVTTRTRTAEAGWTPLSGAQNAFVAITDPAITTVDNNFVTVQKPVIKKLSANVLEMVDFTPIGLSSSRAFRIKFDSKENSNIKDAFFGFLWEGGVVKFGAVFVKNDNSTVSITNLTVSSYATLTDLSNAIYGAINTLFVNNNLGNPSIIIDLFGCGYLSPSLLAYPANTVTSIYTISARGYDVWIYSYFSTSLVRLGNYIKTTISVTTVSDGYDALITYTNDGPAGDNDFVTGDIRQRIGVIRVEGVLAGYKGKILRTTNGSYFIDYDTLFRNYFGPGLLYPFDKFSPVTVAVGETHAVGVSLLYNFATSNLTTQEFIGQYGGGLAHRFSWLTDTVSNDLSIVNADCLARGQSMQVTVSVRVTRNTRDWVKTLAPYKAYFAATYGSVSYMKDPRPVRPVVPAITSNGQPLYYHGHEDANNQNPAIWGWAWYANKIKYLYNTLGYERFFMWCPAGLYYNGNSSNYPSIMLTPFFDTNGIFPHSSAATVSDTCYTRLDNGACVPGTFSVNPNLLKGTIYMLRDAVQEVPVFGFYQGYGTTVHKQWNPENKDVIGFENMGSAYIMNKATNELHLMANYAKTNMLGLDAYASGTSGGLRQNKRAIDFIGYKYDGLKLLAEKSPEDITNINCMSYLFHFELASGPNVVADYILPGHESLAMLYLNFVWSDFPWSTYNEGHTKNMLAAFARWGYVVSSVDNEIHASPKSSLVDSSIFNAADRRFVYDQKPASVSSLAPPSGLQYKIIDAIVSQDYPDVHEQSIILSWNANTEADFSHYIVSRARIINGEPDLNLPYQEKLYTKKPIFVDYQVFPARTYYYKIVAYDVYGNASSPTFYEVTHIADDPILNPPKNISSTANIGDNNIVVSWNAPSSSFEPSSLHKTPPKIIIQGSRRAVDLGNELFDLSNTYILVNEFVTYGNGDARTMAERAAEAIATIVQARDRWVSVRPNEPFRWAFWPQNYGSSDWGTPNNALFRHSSDFLSGGLYSGVWSTVGIQESRSRMQEYFGIVANALAQQGIPPPYYLDPDYEGDGNLYFAGGNENNRNQWHNLIMADARAYNTLFDGSISYADYTAQLKDLDGLPVSTSELYPYIYDLSLRASKLVHVYSSIGAMRVDWGLYKSLFEPAKEVWPNVICGNWLLFGSTRQYLANGYRFRESPVDFGPNMKSDVHVPANYGWGLTDWIGFPVGSGTNNYYECASRYNIDLNKIKNPNEIVKAMRIASLDYSLRACEGANVNKPIAAWLQYNNLPLIYNNLYEGGNPKYPNGFSACVLDDREHMMNLFRVMNKRNVSMVGWFCGQTLGLDNTQEDTADTYSKIYKVVSNLQEAGYIV